MSNRRGGDPFLNAAKRARLSAADDASTALTDDIRDVDHGQPVREFTEMYTAAVTSVDEQSAREQESMSTARVSPPPSTVYLQRCTECSSKSRNYIFGTRIPEGLLPTASMLGSNKTDTSKTPAFGFACTEESCGRIYCHECIVTGRAAHVCKHASMIVSQPVGVVSQSDLLPVMMLAVIARITQVYRSGDNSVMAMIGIIITSVVTRIQDHHGGPIRVASQITEIRRLLGDLFEDMHRRIPGMDTRGSTPLGMGIALSTTGDITFSPSAMFGTVGRTTDSLNTFRRQLKLVISGLQPTTSAARDSRIAKLLSTDELNVEQFIIDAIVANPDMSTAMQLVEATAKLIRARLSPRIIRILNNTDNVLADITCMFTEISAVSSPIPVEAMRAMFYIIASDSFSRQGQAVLDVLLDTCVSSSMSV